MTTSEANPALTHCQICARPILARTGLIAHHGYLRPGQGWQTSSCPGARYRPYEVASDRLATVIAWQVERGTQLAGSIAKMLAEPPPLMIDVSRDAYKRITTSRERTRPEGFSVEAALDTKVYQPCGFQGNRQYAQLFREQVNSLRSELKQTAETESFLRARLAAWTEPTTQA